MKYRKLRIAWSVAWGVVAVLLCALWVRSYWIADSVGWCCVGEDLLYGRGGLSRGVVFVGWRNIKFERGGHTDGWWYSSYTSTGGPSWANTWSANNRQFVAPHWFLVALSTTVAAFPWLRSIHVRFSLRTLLIATTLVALGLGVVVWAAGN